MNRLILILKKGSTQKISRSCNEIGNELCSNCNTRVIKSQKFMRKACRSFSKINVKIQKKFLPLLQRPRVENPKRSQRERNFDCL